MKAKTIDVILVLDRAAPDGVTNQAVELARYLNSEGASVFFLVGRTERPLDEMPGVDVRVMPEAFRPVVGWFALRRLAAELPVGYRVVHAASASSLPAAQALAERLSLPVMVTVHRSAGGSLAAVLKKSSARWIVSVSEALRSTLVNQVGLERSRMKMIPDGITPERYPEAVTVLRKAVVADPSSAAASTCLAACARTWAVPSQSPLCCISSMGWKSTLTIAICAECRPPSRALTPSLIRR